MRAYIDHGLREALVSHCGHSNQQLAFEKTLAFVDARVLMGRHVVRLRARTVLAQTQMKFCSKKAMVRLTPFSNGVRCYTGAKQLQSRFMIRNLDPVPEAREEA